MLCDAMLLIIISVVIQFLLAAETTKNAKLSDRQSVCNKYLQPLELLYGLDFHE